MLPSWRIWGALITLVGLTLNAFPDAAPHGHPQAAVTPVGWAILDGERDAKELTEIDRNGNVKQRATLKLPAETKVVGGKNGTFVIWPDEALYIAKVEKGKRGVAQKFGTSVKFVCEGVASSSERFGVGWIERKTGELWFLHGPGPSAKLEGVVAATDTSTSWCSLASAGNLLALFWRVQDHLAFNTCDKRSCGQASVIDIDLRNKAIRGVGCVPNATGCAIATGGATPSVTWVARAGKRRWQKALPDARPDAHAAVVGATKHALVAWETTDGLRIAKAGPNGALEELWRGRGDLPTLAWANGALVLGYRDRGGAIGTIVLAVAS